MKLATGLKSHEMVFGYVHQGVPTRICESSLAHNLLLAWRCESRFPWGNLSKVASARIDQVRVRPLYVFRIR